LGLKEDEAIEHPRITKAIEKAQQRVEAENFAIRKRLLDYDDVMNVQREVIYTRRQEYISSPDIQEEVKEKIAQVAESFVAKYIDPDSPAESWDLAGLKAEVEKTFLAPLRIAENEIPALIPEDLTEKIRELALKVYQQKEQMLGSETMRRIEKIAFLSTVTEKWKDHLYEMDQLRTGIGLRSYAQQNPLIEYKREAYRMFSELLDTIDREAVRFCFWMRPADEGEVGRRAREARAAERARHEKKESLGFQASSDQVQVEGRAVEDDTPQQGKRQPFIRQGKKIGRNDPCPCGSGKKYKKCCGKDL